MTEDRRWFHFAPTSDSEESTTALALSLPPAAAGIAALPRLLGGRGAAAAAVLALPEFLLKGLGRMRWT
jgi:hypothetical protein